MGVLRVLPRRSILRLPLVLRHAYRRVGGDLSRTHPSGCKDPLLQSYLPRESWLEEQSIDSTGAYSSEGSAVCRTLYFSKAKNPGQSWSENFRKNLSLPKGDGAHSIRHSFVTRMRAFDVHEYWIDRLTGHARKVRNITIWLVRSAFVERATTKATLTTVVFYIPIFKSLVLL